MSITETAGESKEVAGGMEGAWRFKRLFNKNTRFSWLVR